MLRLGLRLNVWYGIVDHQAASLGVWRTVGKASAHLRRKIGEGPDINLERLRCLIYADWPWRVAARCLNKDVTTEGNISVKLYSAKPFTSKGLCTLQKSRSCPKGIEGIQTRHRCDALRCNHGLGSLVWLVEVVRWFFVAGLRACSLIGCPRTVTLCGQNWIGRSIPFQNQWPHWQQCKE